MWYCLLPSNSEKSFVSCVDVVRHSQCSILIVWNGVRDIHFLPSSAKLCSVRDRVLGTLTSFFPNPNRLPHYEMFVRSFDSRFIVPLVIISVIVALSKENLSSSPSSGSSSDALRS